MVIMKRVGKKTPGFSKENTPMRFRKVDHGLMITVALLCALSYSSISHASSKALGGFNRQEMESISPLLRRGRVVSLIETKDNGFPKAMTLAVRINAPRPVSFSVFEDPKKFHFLSTLFEEAKILDGHKGSTAYSWASRHKLFSFVGLNTVALFPPRRVDVSVVKSSLGKGDFRINFYEDGADHSIMVLSGIVDVNSSDWLIKFLMGNSPGMRQAMNTAIGIVIIKGAKAMAELMASGKPLAKHRTRGSRSGPLKALGKEELQAVEQLLDRGTVVVTSSVSGGKLDQAIAVAKVNAPAVKFIGAVATPEHYPTMVRAMNDIVIHERNDLMTDFSWTVGFSIFGLTTRSHLTFVPDGMTMDAVSGDLAGGLWRWQVVPREKDSCIVAYHSWAAFDKNVYILWKSIRREPYLEHGFMAGSNMVMLRAVRLAVEAKTKQ